MKTFVLASTMALALVSGEAMAVCSETSGWKKMNAAGSGGSLALSTLGGKTVCVGSAPTWQAQEFHQVGGTLIDYKRGSGHPIDPTKTIGTWSVSGNQIAYSYTSGGSYTFDVYEKNGAYSFCTSGGSAAEATIRDSQGPC